MLFVSYSRKKFDTFSILSNLLTKFLTKTKYLRIYITTEKAPVRYDSYHIRYITQFFLLARTDLNILCQNFCVALLKLSVMRSVLFPRTWHL